jgi:hypothetical protein
VVFAVFLAVFLPPPCLPLASTLAAAFFTTFFGPVDFEPTDRPRDVGRAVFFDADFFVSVRAILILRIGTTDSSLAGSALLDQTKTFPEQPGRSTIGLADTGGSRYA